MNGDRCQAVASSVPRAMRGKGLSWRGLRTGLGVTLSAPLLQPSQPPTRQQDLHRQRTRTGPDTRDNDITLSHRPKGPFSAQPIGSACPKVGRWPLSFPDEDLPTAMARAGLRVVAPRGGLAWAAARPLLRSVKETVPPRWHQKRQRHRGAEQEAGKGWVLGLCLTQLLQTP